MSRELIKPRDFRKAETAWSDEEYALNAEQKAELSSLYEGTTASYKPGTVIVGRVIKAGPDGVLVDINYKSDGLIPLHEFSEHELKRFAPDSSIEVIIDELETADGTISLSYEKAKALKAWDSIMKLYESGKPVEGTVTHKVKGGLSVDIGIPAFLPGSQVDVQRVNDFDQFVGQLITAYIIKVNPRRGNVIISRRKYLHEQRSEVRKKILDTLSVGQIIQGVVKNITNYGAFIDIGGVDGLLHITDMTWGRIAHPSEMLKIGDTITVQVLSFDKDNEKISLGIKQLEGNPWQELPESVTVGSRVKGAIASITDYGLFIEIAKGVEGLVHISEVSWTDRISDLHKLYKVGDEIEALVVSLDKENRRMSLSVKQLDKNPWDVVADSLSIGQRVHGRISNITDFGVFVTIVPGVDGLVHVSDLSWTEHVKHPADVFKKNDEVEAVVTDINRQKRKISLGIKQLNDNPWNTIEERYPIGSTVEGEVTKITNFGAFVKLPDGIEGLAHISELSGASVERVEDVISVGQKAEFRVISVNKEDHKLGLSLKPESLGGEHSAPRGRRGGSSHERHERHDSHRPERHDRGERPARREQREHREHREHREQSSVMQQPKMKSQFQLELEKHAARRSNGEE